MTEQLGLVLNPEPLSSPILNSSTDPASDPRKRTLQAKCWRALERLLEGPASAVELRAVAGWRYGSRLGELRPWIAWAAGRAPYLAVFRTDPERNPIVTTRATSANPIYSLAAWAIPAARELLAARR